MMERKNHLRSKISGFRFISLWVLLFAAGCSVSGDNPTDQNQKVTEKTTTGLPQSTADIQLPPGISQYEGSSIKNQRQMEAARSLVKGKGEQMGNHPDLRGKEKIHRSITIPQEVKGKWKAVKLLIKNKVDEEQNQMKTVDLGSSFSWEKFQIKVGPFLPNFVITDVSYTSMSNRLDNPAVQVVIEENGKQVYKGWAFAKFPEMYAFPHERFGIQLMGFVPEQVS